jgi:hypothetical protein
MDSETLMQMDSEFSFADHDVPGGGHGGHDMPMECAMKARRVFCNLLDDIQLGHKCSLSNLLVVADKFLGCDAPVLSDSLLLCGRI